MYNSAPDAVGWVELGLGFRLYIRQYEVPTLKVAVGRSGGEVRRLAQTALGGSKSMSGREETKCEGVSEWASEDPCALRWGRQADTTGTDRNAALEEYLTRSECVPQAVEWKG